jgi:VWFA-related protein
VDKQGSVDKQRKPKENFPAVADGPGRSRKLFAVRRKHGWFLIVLACCFTAQARAQLAPTPDASPGSTASSAPPGGSNSSIAAEAPTIRVFTNLVDLYFVVRDGHGRFVPDLKSRDCQIEEDDVPQRLEHFTPKSDLPLTMGILLDTSLSEQRMLMAEQQTGGAFLQRILRPRDEAFLISFDVDATLLADFTNSAPTLSRALDSAQVNSNTGNYATNTIPSIGKPRGTLLYDAVYLAANEKLRPETGRKALVLLTDGEDEGSQKTLDEAIEAAQKANAIVYVLLIRDVGIGGMLENPGLAPMRRLTQATGGRVFAIGADRKKMQAAFDQIDQELRSQYQAAYTPTNAARDGKYRRIRVTCQQAGQGLHVQARQGYYALLPESAQP